MVGAIRSELHRYCARPTGSVIEGEDIAQDTLARAFAAHVDGQAWPAYFILLTCDGGRVQRIRDLRDGSYIADEAAYAPV